MNKRFALFLGTMLVFAVLISACSAESKDAGKDYMAAVLKGQDARALDLACESFDGTQTLLDFFRDEVKIIPGTVDLQVDLGKTNNQEELRITGAGECAKDATVDCGKKNEYVLSEKKGTLVILKMKEVDGDWCVSEESEFGGTPLDTMPHEGSSE